VKQQRVLLSQNVCDYCGDDLYSVDWHENDQVVDILFNDGYSRDIFQIDAATGTQLNLTRNSTGFSYWSTIGVPCQEGCFADYSPTRATAFYVEEDRLLMWDVAQDRPLFTLDLPNSDYPNVYYWSHNGQWLAIRIQQQPLRIYDVWTGKVVAEFSQIPEQSWQAWFEWSPNDQYIMELKRGIFTLWQRQ
jgi:hypothetical protein